MVGVCLLEIVGILWKDSMSKIQLRGGLDRLGEPQIKSILRLLNQIDLGLMRTLNRHQAHLHDQTSEILLTIKLYLILIHCNKMNQSLLRVTSLVHLKPEQ